MSLPKLIVTWVMVVASLGSAHCEQLFILVDNSGSMATAERRQVVEEVIDFELGKIGAGTDVSVTFFQGPSGEELSTENSNCESEVAIEDTEPYQPEQWDLQIPAASGSTPILSALDALAKEDISDSDQIVLITDGSYACAPLKEICTKVDYIHRSAGNAAIKVSLVDPTIAVLDELSCITAPSRATSFEFSYSPNLLNVRI